MLCFLLRSGSTKPRAKNERLVLAPPPPRGRNYWKQAQAWLPRNIPGSKSAAYSLRKAANQLKPWKVDRKWLVSIQFTYTVSTYVVCCVDDFKN